MSAPNSGSWRLTRRETIVLREARRCLVLHCSDIHVGRRFRPEPAQRLVALARKLQPDAVIVSGDLTMRARRGQFRDARAILERLPQPLVVIPGNHDIPLYNWPMRFLAPFFNYRRWVEDLDAGVLSVGPCSVFPVNTVVPFFHQKGWVREADLEAIEEWSRELDPSLWRVVVVHQHFANTPDNPRPGIYRQPERLLERLGRAGIHLVLHGHVHASGVFWAREFFASFPYPLVIAAAGTVSSGRTRGGERIYQLNTLEFEPERLAIRVWNWDAAAGDFVPAEQRCFERREFQTASGQP